jgi:hypothetical protein
MPIEPSISASFSSPTLVGRVLSNPVFATNGYLWGVDGATYYCFFNPNRLALRLWKKRFAPVAFVLWGAVGVIAGFVATPAVGFIILFETAIFPFLVFRHYKQTAQSLAASAVSNGPQMRLPGDMQFETVAAVSALIVLVPTVVGAILGVKLFGIGAVFGAGIGALTGVNATALFLFVIGLLATPFNSVYGGTFSEAIAAGNTNTAHFGRTGTAFATYFLNVGDTPAVAPACGGLTPIVVAGAPASLVAIGQVAQIYADLVGDPRPLVVWALLPLDEAADPWITEAFASQESNYQGTAPRDGVILVVGTTAWTAAHTAALIAHGVVDAAATDGSQSALLGSDADIRIDGDDGFLGRLSRLAGYRDPVQRYGLMMT